MTRQRTQVRAVVGDIVALFEAAYHFKARIGEVLDQMSILHMSMCAIFDRLGIRYELRVEPGIARVDNGQTEPAPESSRRAPQPCLFGH